MNKTKNFMGILGLILCTTSLVFFQLLTSGCSPASQQYALHSSMLTVEVSNFKSQYAQVEKVVRLKQAEEKLFTDEEWRKMLNVDASIDMLMMKADAIIRLDPSNISLGDVNMMYMLAKTSYKDAYQVVASKWDTFTPSTKLMFEALDQQAINIDNRIQILLEDPTNANITQTLTLITGIVGVSAKLLGLAVL